MKFGLLYSKHTEDLSQDILSYAVMSFLPDDYCLIDRAIPSGANITEKTAVIYSGEIIQNPYNFLPSNNIYPLFVSSYIENSSNIEYISGINKEYLSFYSPIGTKDEKTHKMLQAKGVNSYVLGDMLLTLKKRDVQKTNDILFVDVSIASAEENGAKALSFTCSNPANLTWQQRILNAEQTLNSLQGAKLVVTQNANCATVCAALETNVIFIGKNSACKFLHGYEKNDVFSGGKLKDIEKLTGAISIDKTKIEKERSAIVEKLEQFVKHMKTCNETDLDMCFFDEQTRATEQAFYIQNYLCNFYAMTPATIDRVIENTTRNKAQLINKITKGNLKSSFKTAIKKRLKL